MSFRLRSSKFLQKRRTTVDQRKPNESVNNSLSAMPNEKGNENWKSSSPQVCK